MKNRPCLLTLLLPLALLAAPAVQAQAGGTSAALLDIVDPEGDDHGAGNLVYPRDSAFARGDLDLRRLRVFAEPGGLRFEATFANPVRHPSSVHGTGLGSEDLSLFARRGFYAFNLDLYLDTDRVPGSGVQATLPGRGARLHAGHAWDKAIVLTPRPELMRRQLVEALAEASPGATDSAAASSEVGKAVHFATDVRVRGNTVSFSVPRAFMDPSVLAGASLTALVTGAKLTIEAPFGALTLGAQSPAAGRPETTMGYSGERPPATAVVDLLAPDPAQQVAQLATGSALTGLGGRAAPPVGAASAVAPDGGARRPSWLAQALDIVTGFTPRPQPAAVPTAAGAIGAAGAATPAAVAPAATRASEPPPRRARDAAFYEQQELRLRALQRLREQGLITEEEYQRKRREVLEDL